VCVLCVFCTQQVFSYTFSFFFPAPPPPATRPDPPQPASAGRGGGGGHWRSLPFEKMLRSTVRTNMAGGASPSKTDALGRLRPVKPMFFLFFFPFLFSFSFFEPFSPSHARSAS